MAPPPVIRLHPDDNVVIARVTLLPGTPLADNAAATQRIPSGHKASIRPIARGEAIRRYGQIIGFASADIASGQHVHVHNCEMGDFAKDYAYGVDAKPTEYANPPATFQGIRRPDGKVATRNYIGILTSVNCSAHVAGLVANMFQRNPFTGDDPLADYPNVDGVVALTHKTGCGMTQDEPLRVLRRTLAGYARHPNFSHVIVLGLGCEVNQIGGLMEEQSFAGRLRSLDIQTVGGTRKTVAAGVDFVREVLAESNAATRETVPVSALTVALQCGGSDGYSGVSANPALGLRQRPGRAPRRLRHSVGNAGNLRRRTPADPPRGVAGGGRETRRPDALVGRLHQTRERRDERQSLARQQGRRVDDHSGKVARRDGQGGQHQPRRCRAIRRGSESPRLRVHGHARLRPGLRDRAGGGRRQPGVFHHRPGLRVRLQTRAVDQARDQLGDVPPYRGRYGRELRHHPGRRRHRSRNAASGFST